MKKHLHYNALLNELLQGLVDIPVKENIIINAIETDSRLLTENSLFIALPGVSQHGLEYLSSAVKAGAVAAIYDKTDVEMFENALKDAAEKILLIAVDSIKDTAGKVADRFYQHASEKMHVIAVTGTDGKTSVTRFVAQAVSGIEKSAVIGTTGNGLWGDVKEATHTTPDMLTLHKTLAQFSGQGVDLVAMEVSSHAIDQNRIAGVNISTAVLTNISRDHLDYHGTVEKYRDTKKQLFKLSCIKNIVLNIDDMAGAELADELAASKTVWVYGFDKSATRHENYIVADQVNVMAYGFNVLLNTSLGKFEVMIPLLGRFNISNVMAVIAVMFIKKVSLDEIIKSISCLQTAPGRMQAFSADGKPTMVVDFAHTPKALEHALLSLREHFEGELWCVFGCGGDRDKGKRPLMGAVAERLADKVIITDDNPRTESSQEIVRQILAGIHDQEKVTVISDRKQAIDYACEQATEADVVLVAGKGHETYQIVGENKFHFSDSETVQKCLGCL